MSDIRVEEVDHCNDPRQPNVTMISPKAHLSEPKEAQSVQNPVHTVDHTIPISGKLNIEQEVKTEKPLSQQISNPNHPQNPEIQPVHRPIKDIDEKQPLHLMKIPPLSITSEFFTYTKHPFKNVKQRKPYISKESYRSILRSSAASVSHHRINKQQSNRWSKASIKESRSDIFAKLPGLIDFGLTVNAEDCSVIDDDDPTESVREATVAGSLNRPSAKLIDNTDRLQDEINRRAEERQSAYKIKKMERYLQKFETYENLFLKKQTETLPEYRPPTGATKVLPSKPPTEKERFKVVDFNERHRFRIKRNRLQDSVYGKPVCQWGIKVGGDKPGYSKL